MEANEDDGVIEMTFYTIDEYGYEESIGELVKGLKLIYMYYCWREDKRISRLGNTYEDFIEQYISMLICSYPDEKIQLFGKLVREDICKNFIKKIVEIVRGKMEHKREIIEGDSWKKKYANIPIEEEFIRKSQVLLDSIES
jgi:hypothetical protein